MLDRLIRTMILATCAVLVLALSCSAAARKPVVKTAPGNINPTIKSIKVTGSGPVSTKTVVGMMKTKPGKQLDINMLMRDIQSIQSYYTKQGYAAQITPDVGVNPKGVLVVPVLVSKVEKITVAGLPKAKQAAVLAKMKTKVGGVYNSQTLKKDVQGLHSSGALKNARQSVTPGSKAGLVKVTVQSATKAG